MWPSGLSPHIRAAHLTRLGRFVHWMSGCSSGELLFALLLEVPQALQYRSQRCGAARWSLHPSGDPDGGAPSGRRWLTLPPRELASVARPPRVCALCHPAELDGGWGEKRRKGRGTARFWTGRLRRFRAMWRPMNSMRGPTVCSQSSIIGSINGFSTRSSITIPIMTTNTLANYEELNEA